ncbi:MAG: penicillin acylase family protein [Rhodospirillales bacterium]|nr:penicillin acylase family protein [Rhodospirillales bacterium]
MNPRDKIAGGATALGLLARALASGRPAAVETPARLAMLPKRLPVARPLVIHWDTHQIPFIEAETEADLAVGVGVVHAHLRLAQMEMLRRLSQGRIAEVVGALAVPLDRTLRTFDFARAVPAIMAGLTPGTRRWAEGFLAGVNAVIGAGTMPPEFTVLGFRPEPWTLADLFTAARLAAADVNWLLWGRLLKSRANMGERAWRELWPRLVASGRPAEETSWAAEAVAGFARHGSNAAAVAGARSQSGSALLAADPHLSVALPNVWLAVGLSAPEISAAGLMPAGFPVIGIGRNRHLAWAGTNLHAASSDLFDMSGLPVTERREVIRVRGGRVRELVAKETALGPVVSGGIFLRDARPLALSWMGHRPSDEMGAMLAVMRAESAEAFRAALEPFAVPGLSMVHAGSDGRVGQVTAVRLPRRPPEAPEDMVLAPQAARAWDEVVGSANLPWEENPATGFVASANDPKRAEVLVGVFFSTTDRLRRMRRLLGGSGRIGLSELAALQQDVVAEGAGPIRDLLLEKIGPARTERGVGQALAAWGGDYEPGSAGALVFEVMLAVFGRRLEKEGRLRGAGAIWTARALLAEEIGGMSEAAFAPHLSAALRAAARALARWRTWGGAHRMRMEHQFAKLPLVGRRFRFGEWAAPGGKETLQKTAHPPVRGRHGVSYGASARFLADLAGPDENRVVLLGGQDGWLGSANFIDQAGLWRAGEYIALPLRPERARSWPHHTLFEPLSGPA